MINHTDRHFYVYTAYDSKGRELYVGVTGNPDQRYRAHMSGNEDARGWFNDYVYRWRVSGPYEKAVAYRLERERIQALQPIFNGHSEGNRRTGRDGFPARRLAATYLATAGRVDLRVAS